MLVLLGIAFSFGQGAVGAAVPLAGWCAVVGGAWWGSLAGPCPQAVLQEHD